jgi:hypothetical protein
MRPMSRWRRTLALSPAESAAVADPAPTMIMLGDCFVLSGRDGACSGASEPATAMAAAVALQIRPSPMDTVMIVPSTAGISFWQPTSRRPNTSRRLILKSIFQHSLQEMIGLIAGKRYFVRATLIGGDNQHGA